MSAMPTAANRHRRRASTAPDRDRLHALPAAATDPDDEAAPSRFRADGVRTAAVCGAERTRHRPGMGSCGAAPRCTDRCTRLDPPTVPGTPDNGGTPPAA
ncbi:hypothetical protein SUDANB121_00666 [Nocardiopsis dassonvillei]|uniref:hypothetical protein n=1 Tax=Nocardiopsis dassonvillei TaxID=2014 RepID=UPI003F579D42